MGLDSASLPKRGDRNNWPALRQIFTDTFSKRTREEWVRAFEGSDACFAPVLSIAEVPDHPHHRERGVFSHEHGYPEPGPAPRLSRTPGNSTRSAPRPGEGGASALADWNFSAADISRFEAIGAIIDNQ